ncbi:uncharacterized protein LOC134830430 [Culicoides brevitarsis]|uniref:uncharacterized protein LOC134830430 n=1 Tax=Culicoides brevitarsis TaxID=469753 RepID=UPI00307B9505
MTNVESNSDNAGASSRDSGRFNYLKNLKAYRDHGESFEDPSFGDSGYGHSRHLTFNSTEAGASILRHSHSVLKTIDEEPRNAVTATPASTSRANPAKHVTILTPTTQSIQRMSSLHLTTPEGGGMASAAMDMSPFPTSNDDFTEPKTPPELLLSFQEPRTVNSTPRKSKMYGRKRSFRDQIETTDTENENYGQKKFRPAYAKDDNDEKLARRMPFSPVAVKSNRRTLRQRSVSDNNLGLVLRSSTPKTFLMRPPIAEENTLGAIPKKALEILEDDASKMEAPKRTPKKTPKKTLRRYQSFSPSKLAKKDSDRFKKFFNDLNQPAVTEEKNLKNIPEEEPRFTRQDALDISETRDMPESVHCSLNIPEVDLSFLNGVAKSISPIKRPAHLDTLFEAPILQSDDITSITCPSLNASQTLPSMSFLSFEKPSSSNGSSLVPPSPSPSKKGLVYRDLPRTPSKGTSLVRTKSQTPSKKHLLERRTHYYDGMELLDIIHRLQSQGVCHIIEDIFQYLSGEDLINSSKVSKKWRSAILNNKFLNNRRLEYITQIKIRNAENLSIKEHVNKDFLDIPNRRPFSSHNYDTRGMERIRRQSQYSPPASPGKIKFRENQKVVRRLSPRAMTTCPRCAKPSPIITQKKRDCIIKIGRSTRSSAKKAADLTRTSSDPSPILSRYRHSVDRSPIFDLDDSGSSSSSNGSSCERKIRRTLFPAARSNTLPYDISKRSSINSSMNSTNSSMARRSRSFQTPDANNDDSLEEYAMCTGKLCGFRFCVRCNCEYHSNHICHASIVLNSPNRDDDSVVGVNKSNRCGSRQSKRNLKRL